MRELKETFKCMNKDCNHTYKGISGIADINGNANVCPNCGSIYVEWLNFKQDWKYNHKINEWERK